MYPQRSVMTCGLATALEPPHFNHAPVRGAIGASFSRRSRAGSFNPRTRVGCDQCVCVSCLQLHCVSIHAPAWGATPTRNKFAALLAAICARIGSRKAKSKAGEIPPFFVSPVVVWGMAESAGEGAGANPFSGSGHSGTVAACAALPGPNWPAGMLHACRS